MTIDPLELLRGNGLLAALPGDELAELAELLEPVELALRDSVYELDEPIDRILFPVDSVISLLAQMQDGRSVEVATVGREGFVGVPLFLQGAFTSAHRAFCQVSGAALRADGRTFVEHVSRAPALHALLHRYTLALLTQIAQSSACNRLHTLEQRCARWLLLTQDRVGRDTFPMTQEFLGQMLGVRRAGVNQAQQELAQAAVIHYARGQIRVLDRGGLEARACECYRVIRDEHDRLASRPA